MNLGTTDQVAPANNIVNPMVQTANAIQAVATVAPANIIIPPSQQSTE